MTTAEALEQLEGSLPPRLAETLTLWKGGASNPKIAAVLGVDVATVSRYRRNIRRKADGLGLEPELLPLVGVAAQPAKVKPLVPVLSDREWAAARPVVERCARCSWNVTAPLDEARQAFQQHECCHFVATPTVAARPGSPREDESPALAGLLRGGRYWARTSDPQLVELVLSQLS